MGLDVSIVVSTFGGVEWSHLANTRAIPSAWSFKVPVVHHHGSALDDARNGGLAKVDTEWVCFLDADDELEPGYLEAMATGTADVRAPAVRYVQGATTIRSPAMPNVAGHRHACVAECLAHGNWLVVGALVRAQTVRDVGGWRDFAWSEDYDLWVRVWQAGATFEAIPTAVYRAHVRANSRNRGQSREAKLAAHRAIAEANGLPMP